MSKIATLNRANRLKKLCKNYDIIIREFNTNSFRLTLDDKTIDYYPKSNKCFWHSDSEWGEVTDLKGFLKFEFL